MKVSGHVARAAVIMCSLVIGLAVCAQQPEQTYLPGSTLVAILPVANMSGLKADAQMTNLAKAVAAELHRQFVERGFKIVEGEPVDDAIARLEFDITDAEQQKRAVLRGIAKELRTDLVAFVTITDVTTNSAATLLLSAADVHAKVKCWLLDVNSERSLLSAKVEAVDKTSIQPGAGASQMSAAARGVVQAVTQAFERVLKPYPMVRKANQPAKAQDNGEPGVADRHRE